MIRARRFTALLIGFLVIACCPMSNVAQGEDGLGTAISQIFGFGAPKDDASPPPNAIAPGMMMQPAAIARPALGHIRVSSQGDDANDGVTAPVKTLTRARDIIRQWKKDGTFSNYYHIQVLLMDDLCLTEPLVFTAEDSGTRMPITYLGFNDAPMMAPNPTRPTISGGREIIGWKRGENNIWTAELPEVKEGKWSFRQLFADGEKLQRAKTPNKGYSRVAGFPDGGKDVHYHTDCKRFEYADGDIDPNWHNLNDVEVIVYHFWTDSHLPIESIDAENRIVTFKHKAGKVFTDDFTSDGARYIVENTLEGLDQPGEWYLDRKSGVLYLMLEDGQTPNTMNIVAPVAQQLIRFEGDPENGEFVENISFANIRFEYTNFDLPRGNSNDRQGSASVPAAISMRGVKNCSFSGCNFENLGTFAFELGDGCSSNTFIFNQLRHIGGGAFRVDGGTTGDHPFLRTRNNHFLSNTIEHYGDEFPSAVGILLMNTSGNQVEGNEISHGFYTGISAGWQWGYQRSVARDNVISNNHIHHIGQGLLSDMGGIYTLGVSPGTVIRNNTIHDIESHHYGGWGIYNDEGSSHILIEKNVVYNTKFAPYNIHFAKEVTVRNNVFALGRLEQLSRSRAEPHKSCFFENNIIYWTEGELLAKNWKDKPYTFHFHPKDASGTREEKSTFDMDWNIYWNPKKKLEDLQFNGMTFAEWQASGKDRHSIYADPMFVDPENGDFTLKENSPALKMGFEPDVGARSRFGMMGIMDPMGMAMPGGPMMMGMDPMAPGFMPAMGAPMGGQMIPPSDPDFQPMPPMNGDPMDMMDMPMGMPIVPMGP